MGRGENNLLLRDLGPESRLLIGGREKRRAKTISGMEKRKKKKENERKRKSIGPV